MIETPAENLKNNDRNDFTKLLKVDLVPKYEKKKVKIIIHDIQGKKYKYTSGFQRG